MLDSKDRTFTLGEGAYANQVMDITAAQTETPDQPDEPEKEPGQSDDADTRLNKDYTAMLPQTQKSIKDRAVRTIFLPLDETKHTLQLMRRVFAV